MVVAGDPGVGAFVVVIVRGRRRQREFRWGAMPLLWLLGGVVGGGGIGGGLIGLGRGIVGLVVVVLGYWSRLAEWRAREMLS